MCAYYSKYGMIKVIFGCNLTLGLLGSKMESIKNTEFAKCGIFLQVQNVRIYTKTKTRKNA